MTQAAPSSSMGCFGSAVTFNPASQACRSCSRISECHSLALASTRVIRPGARATFLAIEYAMPDLDESLIDLIQRSPVSDQIKGMAYRLHQQGFRVEDARLQLLQGVNPLTPYRTRTAAIRIFDSLIAKTHSRKADLVQMLIDDQGVSRSAASVEVSRALALGGLFGWIDVSRFTVTLNIEAREP